MDTSLKSQIQQLRENAVNYIPGTKIGLDFFVDADPGEMDATNVRIALFGMTGVGKSAFTNTLQKIVDQQDYGTATEQSFGGEGTTILEEYFPDKRFRFIDTRGFFDLDESAQQGEFFRIIYGCVPLGLPIDRNRDNSAKLLSLTGRGGHKLKKEPLSQQIHGLIWVIKGDDIRLNQRKYAHNLEFIREVLRREPIPIITVITHDDNLGDGESGKTRREEVKKNAQEITGSSSVNTFFIGNWLKTLTAEYSDEYKLRALEILHNALKSSEDSIKMRQTNRRLMSNS